MCDDGGGRWKVVVVVAVVGMVVLWLMNTAGVLSETERGSPEANVESAVPVRRRERQ